MTMLTSEHIKHFYFLAILIFLISCARQVKVADFTVSNNDVKSESINPRPKKIWSWTKENIPFYKDQNVNAVDTILYEYDSLYRLVFIDHIVDPIGKDYWHSDSLRFVYNGIEDSLAYQIDYSTYKDGGLRSDTIHYGRDSMFRVVNESATYIHDEWYNRFTTFDYDVNGRPLSKVERNKTGLLKKRTTWTYLDSIRRTIKSKVYHKSDNIEHFRVVDTIDVSADSLFFYVTDLATNTHGIKYLKNGKCANCIKTYKKNKCGKVMEETRIKRPNDTIFSQIIEFDKYCAPIKWTTHTKRKSTIATSNIIRNQYGHRLTVIDSTDGVHVSTTWRKYEY